MRENDLTLDTVEDVRTLRTVAASPQAWERVSPQVKSALTVPLAKMMALGGTLDDLLAAVEDGLQTLAHPVNQNLARTMTALQHVSMSLDHSLDHRADEQRRVSRGRQAQQMAWSAKGAKIRSSRRKIRHKRDERDAALVAKAQADAERVLRTSPYGDGSTP